MHQIHTYVNNFWGYHGREGVIVMTDHFNKQDSAKNKPLVHVKKSSSTHRFSMQAKKLMKRIYNKVIHFSGLYSFKKGFIFRKWTTALREHPSFMVIGTQKGGTTSLASYLNQNPVVAKAIRKEIHYFNANFSLGTSWYRAHFPFVSRTHKRVCFDATPQYIAHPQVPSRIYAQYPQMKFIVLLRNPTDRAYSHYMHECRRGKDMELRTFEEALAFLYELEQEPPVQLDQIGGEIQSQYIFGHYLNYLTRGKYIDQLERWFQLFPREQFLFVQSEYFFTHTREAMMEISRFLEIPYWEATNFKTRNAGGDYVKMDPSTRQQLAEYFKLYNERLYQLLGTDYGWK